MKVKNSSLEIIQMNMLSSFVHFTPGNEQELNDFFVTKDIEIDFDIFNHKENKFQFKILLAIKINSDPQTKKQGYSIITTMEGIFKVIKVKNEIDYQNIKLNSALPMLLSNLRAHIFDTTSKFPAGAYMLPSIDLSDLINKRKSGDKSKKSKIVKK